MVIWSRSEVGINKPLTVTGGLKIPTSTTGPYDSGPNLTPEVYEITATFPSCDADRRGRIAVMQPSGATGVGGPQDSLCFCGYVGGSYAWWCFNP